MSKKVDEYVIERRSTKPQSDPLEEAIESEDRELAREAKRKRLEAIVLERETKIKELRSKLENSGGTPSEGAPLTPGSVVSSLIQGGVNSKMANEWLGSLSPESLGALIALQSNNPMLAMMAFAMGQQKKGGLEVQDVIELNKQMQNRGFEPKITLDIAELVKAVSDRKGSEINPKDIVDSTINAIRTGIELATPTGEKEESWFDKLMNSPEGIKTARDIGLFGTNVEALTIQKEMREADRKFAREMKESDRRFQMALKRMDDESKQRWVEARQSREKTQMIGGALKRIGVAVARAVSESEEGGEGSASATQEGKIRQIKCPDPKCGAIISVPPDAEAGAVIRCARCGSSYSLEKS